MAKIRSFRFDSTNGVWGVRGIRNWSEKDHAIMIGSDTVVGSEEGEYNYDCLFKFADFKGDGFDDLVVRCVAIGEQGKVLEDTTTVYAVQHGPPQATVSQGPATINYCAGKTLRQCQEIKIVSIKIG